MLTGCLCFFASIQARNYDSPNDLVSDRFDNRLLSTITSLTLVTPQIIYVIANFYTLKDLIPNLSLGQMDAEVPLACLFFL